MVKEVDALDLKSDGNRRMSSSLISGSIRYIA